MQLNKDWIVESDQFNIILKKRSMTKNKKTGEETETWAVESYHRNLRDALDSLIDKGIGRTELENLEIICNKIDELKQLIKKVPDITLDVFNKLEKK